MSPERPVLCLTIYCPVSICYDFSVTSQSGIRRKILEALYRCHKAEAFCPLKTAELRGQIGLEDEEEFLKALQFLHDEEYIKGTFVPYLRQGYFESARITKKGVDTVDDPAAMSRLFPTDPKSSKIERFFEDFRSEVHKADLPKEEKERLLEFISAPAVSEIISRIIPDR